MLYFWVFLLGFFCGAVGLLGLLKYQVNKMQKKEKKDIAALEAKAKELEAKIGPVKERLAKVQEITKAQLELYSLADEPSKNALHSKWKNSLNGQIKDMEDEKKEILASIIRDGFDPVIAIMNENNEREMLKLSEYLSRSGITASTQPEPSLKDPTAKKVGKFIVYSGGNDDTTH